MQISKLQIAALEKARLHPAHYDANLEGEDDASPEGVVLDPHQGYLDQANLNVDPQDEIPRMPNSDQPVTVQTSGMRISRKPISIRPIAMQNSRV